MGGLNSAIIERQQEAARVRAEIAVKLYDILQKDNEWHTSKELSEALGLGRERVKTIMIQEVKPKHPDVVSSKHLGYKISKKIEARMPSKRKNTDMKNSEGYSDPTAGMAIRNAEADNPYKSAGEVWRTEAANGDVEYFLVFAEYSTTRLGIPFYIQPGSRFVDPVIIDSLGGAKLYGDCTQVKSKPKKYMIDTIGMIETEQLNDIRRRTTEAIGVTVQSINQPEKVVEPIVIHGKVYTERDILDLLAHEDSLTQLYEQLKQVNTQRNDEIGVLAQEKTQLFLDNKNLKEQIEEKDDLINELILDNKKLKEQIETKTSVVAMKIDGRTYTRDEIVKILAMGAIYKQFFDSYCKGLETGE
jgi:biotin operon repressor